MSISFHNPQSGCLSCKNPSKSLQSESTNSSVANKNTIIRLLNFSTGDVLTTPNDNVFGSVKDVYKALLIHRTNVTRSKPQVSMIINMEDFCSLVWLSPVPVKTICVEAQTLALMNSETSCIQATLASRSRHESKSPLHHLVAAFGCFHPRCKHPHSPLEAHRR